MASLKSMMAAKKAQQRITAPHAKYTQRGQLQCGLCNLPLKHESLWGAHVQSKTHRVNVQKLEAEQAAAAAERASSKRKRDDADVSDDEEGTKRVREEEDGSRGGLPADFFADPAEAPAPRAKSPPPIAGASTTTAAEEDPDWAEFEAYLASAPDPALASTAAPSARTTASATISAAPVRYEFGAPVVEDDGAGQENADEEGEQEETEEERREREEREEREEMMARLEEEEREQREADEKVTVLKRRLEAIRAARQKKTEA
ncbi:hypothetical protein Rt10032_c13g5122 [Rhodotorula toruloides]|uniref:Uncharacterized protein n=1 Tax=Rhodotorula toruloides TaxID=5286 RepID=A0A511KMH7_RHOTO|nr:hypothetical protein Rt10032_c13g5122 [Rhodotorula toruloides]